MSLGWLAAGASDVGLVRAGNEDAFRVDAEHGVFLVADGMGGHAAGEVASALTAEVVADSAARAIETGVPPEALLDVLRDASHAAHVAITACCADRPETRGMGTTLTAGVLAPAPDGGALAHVVHIGDSRLYHLGPAGMRQVTRDHTWVQAEVDAGRLTPQAARTHRLSHILTRVLTDESEPRVDTLSIRIEPGDLLLFATDGLHNMLSDAEIAGVLRLPLTLEQRVARLVAATLEAGAPDNVTAVLVEVLDQAGA